MATLVQPLKKVRVVAEPQDWDLEKLKNTPTVLQDHINLCKKLGLKSNESELAFRCKCDQAEAAGMKRMSEAEIAEMLLPGYKTLRCDFGDRYPLEYFYDPLLQKSFYFNFPTRRILLDDENASVITRRFFRKKSVEVVPMDALKVIVPYGILLRVDELRELNFFNCFLAFAPSEVVDITKKVSMNFDPIVVATIMSGFTIHAWRGQESFINVQDNCKFAHFFIGRW